MLKTPDNAAYIALDQVTKLPRWVDIDKMIEAELTAILDRILGSSVTEELHELRGRAKALREFQAAAREAPTVLAKKGLRSPIA